MIVSYTSKAHRTKEQVNARHTPSKVECKKDEDSRGLKDPNYPEVPKLIIYDIEAKENKLPPGFFIICEGSRRCGKSIFLQWFLYHYREDFDLVLVCTETPHNGFWQPIVGNQYVHYGWDSFMVNKLIAEQKEQVKEKGKEKARHVLLILDDIVGDRRHIHEDTVLNELAVEGRHSKISICLTTQEPHAIGTSLRNNCDMAVIFQQKSARAKESVCNDFVCFKLDQVDNSKQAAMRMLQTYTNNHDAIIIKMLELKPGIESAYRYLPEYIPYDKRADKVRVPDYQLGSNEQQALARSPSGKKPL
jgi:hypothetical protein